MGDWIKNIIFANKTSMRQNVDLPYERQMLIILHDYDNKVKEIAELRKEVKELTETLEQLGGKSEASSLKSKCNNLKQKNKSLQTKLGESNEALAKERRVNTKLHKRINILLSSLGQTRGVLYDLNSKVEVESLRKLANSITNVMENNIKVNID